MSLSSLESVFENAAQSVLGTQFILQRNDGHSVIKVPELGKGSVAFLNHNLKRVAVYCPWVAPLMAKHGGQWQGFIPDNDNGAIHGKYLDKRIARDFETEQDCHNYLTQSVYPLIEMFQCGAEYFRPYFQRKGISLNWTSQSLRGRM